LRIDLQTYDESQEASVGTCTLLRQFSSRILEDFVLLPCDFIPPPSLLLSALLNKFRTDSMSDGSIATACWFAGHRPGKDATLDEWGPLTPSTSIVWDESSGTLLNIDTPDDIDRNPEELELRISLLSQHVYSATSTLLPLTKLLLQISSDEIVVQLPRLSCVRLPTVCVRCLARKAPF
jgi:translation initiation factor eIF-2B subunit gamma